MMILKCKMCGGNIEITGESHGVCDSCGCEVTLPKLDDDRRAEMYNRGNHFRSRGEFDKAYSAYEHIIAEDGQDAEAHWCLALCRYGIEYVKDPRSGEYKPTCSRVSFEPFQEDRDYLEALNYSEGRTRELYQREAAKIAKIQERYLEISRKEQPYDVFICFKATEENGERTQGSIIAQDIYEQLTEKGLKVFFSRITLEDKLSEEYEPYIFAALHSARVMLVVATKPEHLTSRWVQNEWSRYLAMMDKDKNKSIIPVFSGMSPYDFPPEIPMVQGQDMGKVGAMQDLVRGVLKLTGKNVANRTDSIEGYVTTKNLIVRAKQSIEDREYNEALGIIGKILDIDAGNGWAYFYQLLAVNNISDWKKLVTEYADNDWETTRYYKRAAQYADKELKELLEEFEKIHKTQKQYNTAYKYMQNKEYDNAINIFETIRSYHDSETFLTECKKRKEMDESARKKQIEFERNLEEYEGKVGDGTEYVYAQFKENHAQKLNRYLTMLKNNAQYSRLKKAKVTLQLIVSIVTVVIGIVLVVQISERKILWQKYEDAYTECEEAYKVSYISNKSPMRVIGEVGQEVGEKLNPVENQIQRVESMILIFIIAGIVLFIGNCVMTYRAGTKVGRIIVTLLIFVTILYVEGEMIYKYDMKYESVANTGLEELKQVSDDYAINVGYNNWHTLSEFSKQLGLLIEKLTFSKYIILVSGIVLTIYFSLCRIKLIKGKSAYKEYQVYEKEVILPTQARIISEIKETYEPLIGKENLVVLRPLTEMKEQLIARM